MRAKLTSLSPPFPPESQNGLPFRLRDHPPEVSRERSEFPEMTFNLSIKVVRCTPALSTQASKLGPPITPVARALRNQDKFLRRQLHSSGEVILNDEVFGSLLFSLSSRPHYKLFHPLGLLED